MTFIVDGTNGATFPDTTVQSTALTTGSVTKSMISTSTSTGFGLCRAWCNFGYVASAVVINSSYNVSSVTRTSAGIYVVNFTTAMTDANYAPIYLMGWTATIANFYAPYTINTSASAVTIYTSGSQVYDPPTSGLAVFR